MKDLFRLKKLFILLAVLGLLQACKNDDTNSSPQEFSTGFAVVSDLHYYSPTLGTSGEAFMQYLSMDRKLIAESKEIAKSLLNSIKQENVNFLIVPGDLTKDGEKISHNELAQLFKEVEASGKKVYVVPGNHDINNPHAYSYSGTEKTRVDNVSPADFASI